MSLLDLIPGVSTAKLVGVGLASALVSASLVSTYTSYVTVPAAERDAAKLAQSEMLERFNEVSNELASDAEKFRARRIACRAAGGVFAFDTGDCRQD
ncbi:hypothetical protein [Hoeflea sp.]|uniref:hypothetical protein n=1 Tax=Hoeflea sp. TaxID=1940281 RepID=UPI003B523067